MIEKITEFWKKQILDPYNLYRGRRIQRKITKVEVKAKRKYYRSREYRQKLAERILDINTDPKITEVKIKNRVQKPEIDATEQELLESYGSGIWIYSACNAIAEKSASVVPQIVDQDNETQDPDEILNMILKPHPRMTRFDLFELTQLWLDLSGNAYWYINRDQGQIIPLRPTKVAVVPDKENGGEVVGYAYNRKSFDRRVVNSGIKVKEVDRIDYDDFIRSLRINKGIEESKTKIVKQEEWIPLEANDVIHFKYQHPYNDYYGMSPLQPLLLSLESELYARGWNKRFFENGAIPLGIMIVPDTLDRDDFKNMKDEWEKKHGQGKEHKIAWLNREVEYQEIESSPKDVEFLNLIRMTREDTLAVLNVPPVMVGVYEFSNTSSRSAGVREQRQIFWQDCIIPKLKKIYNQLNLTFYSDSENKLRPDLTDIDALQPEWNEVAKGAKDALVGGLTLEEVREIFWKKTGDPEGLIYLPSTLVPVGSDQNGDQNSVGSTGYELNNYSSGLKKK